MKFLPTSVQGAYIVEVEPRTDERGLFARTFCQREFERRGLETRIAQCNLSFNPRRGTLRGLHFQRAPHAEAKLVRCTRGRVFDIALDLRSDSATYKRWHGAELSAENHAALYIPPGCAHGYLTLEDSCEVSYQVSEFYDPASEGGVRWDDPAFSIRWPIAVEVISAKDRGYPDYQL